MPTPYSYITDTAGAAKARDHLLRQKVIGFDTETTGLDPHTDKVILVSLSCREHTYVVDTRDLNNLRILAPVLENENIYKIAHNGIFDYQMVKGSVGADTENTVCLLLGERCLTAGTQFAGGSLDAVTKKYLGIERDKSLQKSFIGHTGDFSKAQLDYSAEDAAYLLDIAAIMHDKAQEELVWQTWRTENAALPAFGDLHFYGQKIDAEAWKKIMADNEAAAAEAKKVLDKWFAPVCDKDLFGEVVMNYESQPQVLHALQMMGIKVDGETIRDTTKKSQFKIRDLEPIQALMAYRAAKIRLGTFGQTYLNAIHPKTGRVHFKMHQYGTDTGRPKCYAKLNCLNIPREKRFRSAFVTDEDRLISTVDYSAAELRILAELSGDKLMINGFNSGIDFHCYVASMLFGVEVTKTNENKHRRDPTKTLSFGRVIHLSRIKTYSIQGNP